MIPYFSFLTRKLFFKVFALVCFCTLQAAASDSSDDMPVSDLKVFDSETLQAVTNLAIRMAVSSDGTRATAATVEDNVAAILAILQSFNSSGSGYLWNQPLYNDANSLGEYFARVLTSGSFSAGRLPSASVSYFYQIQRALNGVAGEPASSDAAVVPTLSRIEILLSSLSSQTNSSSSSSVDLSAISNLLYSTLGSVDHIDETLAGQVASDVGGIYSVGYNLYNLLDPISFNNDRELLVHDSRMWDEVSSMGYDVYGIYQSVYGIAENQSLEAQTLLDIASFLRTNQIRNAHIDDAGENADSLLETAIDYVPEGSTDYEAIEDEATDDYEDIPLPEVSDSYQPSIQLSDLQSSQEDMGLSGLVLPNDHNALVTLVRNGTVLPDVEVDFGRDSALSNAVGQLGSLFSYLWGVLFSLLLGVKSVVMFRKVRLATSALAVDEKALPVTLSYDPF